MSASTRRGSATRHPMATQESRTPHPSPFGTQRQPEQPHPDMSRPASDRAATPPASSHEPARSEGMPHGSVPGNFFASAQPSDVQRALREQRLLRRRQLLPASRASSGARTAKTLRARIESRLRSVIRLAPLPVLRLVRRISPRLCSDFSLLMRTHATRGRRP